MRIKTGDRIYINLQWPELYLHGKTGVVVGEYESHKTLIVILDDSGVETAIEESQAIKLCTE